MQYSDMKTVFSSILNRTDPTAAQITNCFTLGMARIARELRIPASEILTESTVPADFERLSVPSDCKQIIAITVDAEEVVFKNVRDFLKLDRTGAGIPEYWTRMGQYIYFDKTPPEGTDYQLLYYGTVGTLSADDDEPTLAAKSPDLIIHAALTYAGRIWVDDRKDSWEADYRMYLQETQDEAYLADGPAQVEPAYTFEDTEADPDGVRY
jgi:hypothetical protein